MDKKIYSNREIEKIFESEIDRYINSLKLDAALADCVKANLNNRLTCTENLIIERFDGENNFSESVFDACFPKAETRVKFYHYTTLDKFKSIIDSGELRLYWLYKRIDESEISEFCRNHSLDGYLESDNYYKKLSKDLFYMSLTKNPDTLYLWDDFGDDSGRGIRLELSFEPVLERVTFREIKYSGIANIYAFLQKISRDKLDRSFVFKGLSRAVAFQLPKTYDHEQETRLLVKRFSNYDSYNPWKIITMDEHGHEYLPLPFFQKNDFCYVRLNRVDTSDLSLEIQAKNHLLASKKFKNIHVNRLKDC